MPPISTHTQVSLYKWSALVISRPLRLRSLDVGQPVGGSLDSPTVLAVALSLGRAWVAQKETQNFFVHRLHRGLPLNAALSLAKEVAEYEAMRRRRGGDALLQVLGVAADPRDGLVALLSEPVEAPLSQVIRGQNRSGSAAAGPLPRPTTAFLLGPTQSPRRICDEALHVRLYHRQRSRACWRRSCR